ncbi:hypothetical protein MESS2_660012 [Mesorhizobium metallidurans STM 2683]|uniref:Uncharacterized protein n=1 Tax=Mesorhizobium metallidurans STM 2683 TaxID=1297569 RepID=M5EVL2_9HYPH|nr:hypothetical protein MESS2_660012 [Mesorhizobium metallidurans STM 2683]
MAGSEDGHGLCEPLFMVHGVRIGIVNCNTGRDKHPFADLDTDGVRRPDRRPGANETEISDLDIPFVREDLQMPVQAAIRTNLHSRSVTVDIENFSAGAEPSSRPDDGILPCRSSGDP